MSRTDVYDVVSRNRIAWLGQDDLDHAVAALRAAKVLGIDAGIRLAPGVEISGVDMHPPASVSELTPLEEHYRKMVEHNLPEVADLVCEALNTIYKPLGMLHADMGRAALSDAVADAAEEWVAECFNAAVVQRERL